MKIILKRSSAILLSLMLIAVLTFVPTSAASYVANWGKRGVKCTSLTSYATAYYTGSYSIATLSSKAGGTGRSDAPSSALYSALKSMMTSKHKYQNSYADNKTMLKYTDCENGNTSTISSFYSGRSISGSWDGTWNREHTWPNSKGLGGKDEDDIMMIRPTWTQENSSRGNTAYGKSSGYYNPNSESGGALDLRGDVARICLYVYTRWGNTQYMWGKSGVMESLDVLIEWMTVDPVDTWEMGKNDAVQSITGVRNVYVDYPELAFKLFGYSVPANYSSPSGLGSGIGSGSGTVTPSTSSTPSVTPPTSSQTNVLDQVMGNNSNTNNNSSQPTVSVDQSGNMIDTSKDYENDVDECRHDVTLHKNEIAATCKAPGKTADIICDQCGLYVTKGTTIPQVTHQSNDNDTICDFCGIDIFNVQINIENNNDNSGIDVVTLTIILVGAGLLLIAGAVVLIVVLKNKNKNKQ